MAVTFKLYASDGITLKQTFSCVYSANYPHSEKDLVEHTNIRGKGSLVIDGGDAPWDLVLQGVLFADDYDALTILVDAMESNIVLNTPYYLKITKSVSGGTYYSYKVKRITPIEFKEDNLRNNFLDYQISFRVNSW
jgi:hypothetical protein